MIARSTRCDGVTLAPRAFASLSQARAEASPPFSLLLTCALAPLQPRHLMGITYMHKTGTDLWLHAAGEF